MQIIDNAAERTAHCFLSLRQPFPCGVWAREIASRKCTDAGDGVPHTPSKVKITYEDAYLLAFFNNLNQPAGSGRTAARTQFHSVDHKLLSHWMVCLSTSPRIDRLRFRTNILTHYNTFRGYECINLGAVFRSSSIIRTTEGSLCFICFVLGVCFLRIKGPFFRSTVEVLVAGEAIRPSEAIQMVKLSFGTNKFPDFGGSRTLTLLPLLFFIC